MNREARAERLALLLHSIIRSSELNVTFEIHLHTEGSTPALSAEFFGRDVPLLLARNADLLIALEHIAAKALRLKPEHHHWISFDAAGFIQQRDRSLQRLATEAIQQVLTSGKQYHLSPMNSRERRILHIIFGHSGLHAASEGEGGRRHIVVQPPPGPGEV